MCGAPIKKNPKLMTTHTHTHTHTHTQVGREGRRKGEEEEEEEEGGGQSSLWEKNQKLGEVMEGRW